MGYIEFYMLRLVKKARDKRQISAIQKKGNHDVGVLHGVRESPKGKRDLLETITEIKAVLKKIHKIM